MTCTASLRSDSIAIRLGLALALMLTTAAAQAARPMQTDDARTVDAKACQLESWIRRNTQSTEYWALPACNFSGNLELTLGGAEIRNDGGEITRDLVIQGKTLFKPMESNGWGWGLALGNQRKGSDRNGSPLAGDIYAYVPASFSFLDDDLVLHVNLGRARERASGHQHDTWGLGSESRLSSSTWLIAETFAADDGKPFAQLGLRHWLVQDRVQLDATWGNRINSGSSERWVSLGLRLLSPAFLP